MPEKLMGVKSLEELLKNQDNEEDEEVNA